MESIAYQSAELLAAMQKDAAMPVTEVRADGGAARNDMLMQFQSDLLGRAGAASEGHGDHRTGRRLPGRPGGRLLGIAGRNRYPMGVRAQIHAQHGG